MVPTPRRPTWSNGEQLAMSGPPRKTIRRMTMLNKTKIALLAAIVASTASVAMARPTHAPQYPDATYATDAGWASSAGLDSRSPISRELDPTGGSFQGP